MMPKGGKENFIQKKREKIKKRDQGKGSKNLCGAGQIATKNSILVM